jgi:hypothetical protein
VSFFAAAIYFISILPFIMSEPIHTVRLVFRFLDMHKSDIEEKSMKFARRIFGLGLVLIFTLGCSAPKVQRISPTFRPTATPILPTLAPAALMVHNNLERFVGGKADTIIKAYGMAPVDFMDSSYRPPIIRVMKYPELGLEFNLNKDRIYLISASKPFTGKVFGLKIGDNISRLVAAYGTYETDGKLYQDKDLGLKVLSVKWPAKLPMWFFTITEKGIIARISFSDQVIFGNWIG